MDRSTGRVVVPFFRLRCALAASLFAVSSRWAQPGVWLGSSERERGRERWREREVETLGRRDRAQPSCVNHMLGAAEVVVPWSIWIGRDIGDVAQKYSRLQLIWYYCVFWKGFSFTVLFNMLISQKQMSFSTDNKGGQNYSLPQDHRVGYMIVSWISSSIVIDQVYSFTLLFQQNNLTLIGIWNGIYMYTVRLCSGVN